MTTILALALVSWAQAFSSTAFAVDGDAQRVKAETGEAFAKTAASVRSEMTEGGRYEFITNDEKAKVNADLDAMTAMLQKSGSVAAMSQPEKVQLFNTQEHLNGILTHSDRNRLVCEHKAPIGSHIALTSCKTVAEIEKMRRDGQKMSTDATSVGWQCHGMKGGSGCAANQKMGN
jgi:hypothetical protein